jgi:hypothetical protein
VPDAELDARVQQALDDLSQRATQDDITETLDTDAPASLPPVTSWTDPNGGLHHALPLMAEADGVRVCLGLAMIETSEQRALALAVEPLTRAVAEYLLRAGDAHTGQPDGRA